MLAHNYRPFVVSLRSMLGPLGNDLVTLVLRRNGVCSFLQAHKRPHSPELDISYLASFHQDDEISDGDAWFQLVEELIERAGEARIERVFAAASHHSHNATEVLRQLGFQPYTKQQIWTLPEPAVEAGSSLLALRRQQRRDAWAIQQLYEQITPRHVRQAELRQSTSWQLPRPRRRIGWRETGWVLGNDQSLYTHIHMLTGPNGHVLRLMCDPDLRHDTAAMLRYVLSQINEARTVVAVLRAYQSEFGSALEEVGFKLRAEQTLFVKQLIVRQHQAALVPGLLRPENGLESLPRLPSTGRGY